MNKLKLSPDAAAGAPVPTSTADNVAAVANEVLNEASALAPMAGPYAIEVETAVAAAEGGMALVKLIMTQIDAFNAKGLLTADQQARIAASIGIARSEKFTSSIWQVG